MATNRGLEIGGAPMTSRQKIERQLLRQALAKTGELAQMKAQEQLSDSEFRIARQRERELVLAAETEAALLRIRKRAELAASLAPGLNGRRRA
jgi:hypothetical protein